MHKNRPIFGVAQERETKAWPCSCFAICVTKIMLSVGWVFYIIWVIYLYINSYILWGDLSGQQGDKSLARGKGNRQTDRQTDKDRK
jgi:hypothetical protein